MIPPRFLVRITESEGQREALRFLTSVNGWKPELGASSLRRRLALEDRVLFGTTSAHHGSRAALAGANHVVAYAARGEVAAKIYEALNLMREVVGRKAGR